MRGDDVSGKGSSIILRACACTYPIPLVHLLHVSWEESVDETERRMEDIEVDANSTLVALQTHSGRGGYRDQTHTTCSNKYTLHILNHLHCLDYVMWLSCTLIEYRWVRCLSHGVLYCSCNCTGVRDSQIVRYILQRTCTAEIGWAKLHVHHVYVYYVSSDTGQV